MSDVKQGLSLAKFNNYTWPVDVQLAEDGAFVTFRFTGHFCYSTHDDIKARVEKIKQRINDQAAEEVTGAESDKAAPAQKISAMVDAQLAKIDLDIELYSQLLVGWGEDLMDAEGNKIPVTDENKRALLGNQAILNAVVQAYQESQAGEKERIKNLKASPAGGQQAEAAQDGTGTQTN